MSGNKILIPQLQSYTEEERQACPWPLGRPYFPKSYKNPQKEERNRTWYECALANFWEKASAQEVCRHWSHYADQLVGQIFNIYFDASTCALFALGKWGAEELNLSSDVDLLIVINEENPQFVSSLRHFQKALADADSEGFFFRLDFDLRPGGKAGPLLPTVDQFKDYYGNYAETWERLALVRLRPVCGSTEIINDVMAFTKKFVYRKHLDYTLFDDLKNLRKKIHEFHNSQTHKHGFNLKLAFGGIRDIELFINALQVVHGGKNPELQTHNTESAFLAIQKNRLLPQSELEILHSAYWDLRCLENYVQSLEDRQTHLFVADSSTPKKFTDRFTTIQKKLKTIDQSVASLLGTAPGPEISNVDADLLNEITSIEILSRNKERDLLARNAFVNSFVKHLKDSRGDLSQGFDLLKDFCRATRAKASFFTLLNHNEKIIQQIAWLFGHSSYLARILCLRPELLDSFIFRSQELDKQDTQNLLEQLSEKKLLSEIFHGIDFLQNQNVTILQNQLSATADEICSLILEILSKELNSNLQILALGKWGGRELGFQSDLDFIFISKETPTETDLKVAKRCISRLTEPHRGGSLYNLDLRLRPTGKAGPLVVKAEDFKQYCDKEIVPWEKQAYLKARWICSAPEDLPWKSYIQKGLLKSELEELNSIRLQLISKEFSAKYSEGGLLDIELALQTYLLKNKIPPPHSDTLSFMKVLPEDIKQALENNYVYLRQLEQNLFLVGKSMDLANSATSYNDKLSNIEQNVRATLADNVKLLQQFDPRRSF